jgi:hypothetical protein
MIQFLKLSILLASFFILPYSFCWGQTTGDDDDIMGLLDALSPEDRFPVTAIFKGTRVVSGHSVETNGNGVLQFLIGHRFGRISGGANELFGLDNATIRLGFEYGLTDDFNLIFGRSSFMKSIDGGVKWRFIRQKRGASPIPITATWVSGLYVTTVPFSEPDRNYPFSSRLSYHHAVLIARKWNDVVSVQCAPTIVHRNMVPTPEDRNTLWGASFSGSVKLTGSLRGNVEYVGLLPGQITSPVAGESVRNTLSVGVDLETGGHVFQLHLTNSRGMTEPFLMGQSTGQWANGGIHFGFNVSRVFTIKSPPIFP